AVVRGLGREQEVLRHHREVLRGTRGDEQDGIVVADATDIANGALGAIEHAPEFLAAVAVLEEADAASVEIPDRFLGAPQDFFGENRGTRREVQLAHGPYVINGGRALPSRTR